MNARHEPRGGSKGACLGLILLASAMLTTAARAQVPSDEMFDPSQMREVRVTMAADEWLDIVRNPDPDESGDTRVYRCAFSWNGESLANVGIRAKGQASREPESPKPGVRFLFNRYEGEELEGGDRRAEQAFRGLKKLDANSLRGDPSMMRDRLIENAAARFHLVCPRTMHVRFYVNDAYVGLYLIVDNYDQAAVLRRLFRDRNGNLYKYTWTRDRGADDATRWRGDDPETYVQSPPVFHVLIWDLDNSMVDFLPAELWIPRDIMRGFELHVLSRRVMNVPAWREAYFARVRALIDGAFAPSSVQAEIDSIREQILGAAQEDRNKPYTDAEFEANIALLRRDVPLRVENVRQQLAR